MFDVLSHEYGWTDEMILDLTPGRLELAFQSITERKQTEWRPILAVVEGSVRQLLNGIAFTAFSSKAAKGIIKIAERFRLLDRGEKETEEDLPDADRIRRFFGNARS